MTIETSQTRRHFVSQKWSSQCVYIYISPGTHAASRWYAGTPRGSQPVLCSRVRKCGEDSLRTIRTVIFWAQQRRPPGHTNHTNGGSFLTNVTQSMDGRLHEWAAEWFPPVCQEQAGGSCYSTTTIASRRETKGCCPPIQKHATSRGGGFQRLPKEPPGGLNVCGLEGKGLFVNLGLVGECTPPQVR